MVIPFQSFNDQIIDWKPDRPSPIGVATEQMGVPFAGNIVDPVLTAVSTKNIGSGGMDLRQESGCRTEKETHFHPADILKFGRAVPWSEQPGGRWLWPNLLSIEINFGEITPVFQKPIHTVPEPFE